MATGTVRIVMNSTDDTDRIISFESHCGVASTPAFTGTEEFCFLDSSLPWEINNEAELLINLIDPKSLT